MLRKRSNIYLYYRRQIRRNTMPNCTVSNLSQGCLQAVFDELNKLFNLIKRYHYACEIFSLIQLCRIIKIALPDIIYIASQNLTLKLVSVHLDLLIARCIMVFDDRPTLT